MQLTTINKNNQSWSLKGISNKCAANTTAARFSPNQFVSPPIERLQESVRMATSEVTERSGSLELMIHQIHGDYEIVDYYCGIIHLRTLCGFVVHQGHQGHSWAIGGMHCIDRWSRHVLDSSWSSASIPNPSIRVSTSPSGDSRIRHGSGQNHAGIVIRSNSSRRVQ